MEKEYTDHNLNPTKEVSSVKLQNDCLLTVKDLFAMCNRDKLIACIAAKHKDTPDGSNIGELVAARYFPVLEELAGITPLSDQQHFVLGIRRGDGVEVMALFAPTIRKQLRAMVALHGLSEAEVFDSPELLDLAAKPCHFDSFSFSYIPWREVLGMAVCAENIRVVGAEEMAAQILWEMTEVGFTAAEVDAQCQHLAQLLEASEFETLNDALLNKLHQPETEEQVLANKQMWATTNLCTYNLLMKYEDWWNPQPIFRFSLTMEEIEKNFEDVDFFSGVMEGLEDALAHAEEVS